MGVEVTVDDVHGVEVGLGEGRDEGRWGEHSTPTRTQPMELQRHHPQGLLTMPAAMSLAKLTRWLQG